MHYTGIVLAIHVQATVFLVGGLLFTLLILRPSAQDLADADRLRLWRSVLRRFMPRAWLGLLVLLTTGYILVQASYGGLLGAPPFVKLMLGLALLLALAFAYLHFVHFRRFGSAVDRSDWTVAERDIRGLRVALALVLTLGFLTVIVGSSGRYFLA